MDISRLIPFYRQVSWISLLNTQAAKPITVWEAMNFWQDLYWQVLYVVYTSDYAASVWGVQLTPWTLQMFAMFATLIDQYASQQVKEAW